MVEAELMRQLVDDGGQAAQRCLTWLVEGAAFGPRVEVDLIWPVAPMPL